jgi:hypothetical protein
MAVKRAVAPAFAAAKAYEKAYPASLMHMHVFAAFA